MNTTYTHWKEEIHQEIDKRTASFSEPLHKKTETEYLKRLLEKMATHAASSDSLEEFRSDMEELVSLIPTVEGYNDKSKVRTFYKKKSKLKNTVTAKHKLVPKGYYMGIWMALGMALGMPWGLLLFDNIALGLPIGMVMGMIIGSSLDSKASKEGRVV